jgi:sigma-B regulation protein RsbU (phosphoserine phosphatase)
MSRFRPVAQHLGKTGIAFLIALGLYPIFYFFGPTSLLVLDVLALIPLTIWVAIRAGRFLMRHSLWSLRNRLLCAYGLIGVLPIVLILVLVGLSGWVLMSELAIYLASSELDRRLGAIDSAATMLDKLSPSDRREAAPRLFDAYQTRGFPGIVFYIQDAEGDQAYPTGKGPVHPPAGWGNANGLMFHNGQFFAWSHIVHNHDEITVLAPLTDDTISNLVPELGDIALYEEPGGHQNPASSSPPQVSRHRRGRIPPAVNQFDVTVDGVGFRSHFDWTRPGKPHTAYLRVQSRPSAILGGLFSGTDVLREALFIALVVIAILFLLVEMVALIMGISLSASITGAVNQLYEGTRRVIRGDFRHRIKVRSRDQLGELAESFNQMTENLERLVAVEKEKERLQTELEIAREVQNNLYPKEAPPSCGLQLTVLCDPARMVSGDYYDYQSLHGKKLAFAIGDVAGKGISAALLMATLQATLRAQISHFETTRDVGRNHLPELKAASLVSQINKQIYNHTAPEKYATFFFALFDVESRTLTYTNAGHLSPLLIRGDQVLPLDSNGTVVGAFPFSKYNESCLAMQEGDLLVCYTDGITEPENAYGEMFGEERLIDLVKRHAKEDDKDIVRMILEAVRTWTGTTELFDDMTILLARQV